MYENHREHFGRRSREEEREPRWREAENRYRNETAAYRRDDDRTDWGREDNYGRSRSGRDYGSQPAADYHAGRDFAGSEGYYTPDRWSGRSYEERAGHPYQGTYGGNGDSRYFTGGQGSWAVGDPRRSAYGSGGQRFGEDYRQHGYTGGGHDDDRRGFFERAGDEIASWFGDEDAARRREQDHRGRGPKDYIRSDERIREDANDRLTEDWRVDASNVTVAVQNGEVTLNGTVGTRQAKRHAEDIVDDISGVKHVQNNLRVSIAPTDTLTGSTTL